MWRKNNGFFLAEVMLSLSAWLVIATILFPLIINVVNQSLQGQQEYEGTKLLYETLIKAKKEGVFPNIESIKIDRTVYQVIYEPYGGQEKMEVCVQYEDLIQNTFEKCDLFE